MKKTKKKNTLDQLKETLIKEHNFYTKIDKIRFFIRTGVFTITALLLYFFDILNLDEMVFIFLALILVEYLRFKNKK